MKKLRLIFRRTVGESGQSLVEFTLVLPIFLFFIFNIIDFCWLEYQIAAFEHGYTYVSWDVLEKDLRDPGDSAYYDGPPIDPRRPDDRENARTYLGNDYMNTMFVERIFDASLSGLNASNLVIENAVVECKNQENDIELPGIKEGEKTEGVHLVRTMDINMDVVYTIDPIVPKSFVASLVFGSDKVIKRVPVHVNLIIAAEDRQK